MSELEAVQVRQLSEADIDYALEAAGGTRAHPDADRRADIGADYRLGSTIIELKALDEEGFSKPERQQKLAVLFKKANPTSPVIVLDRKTLDQAAQRQFDRIIEGPIKTAVSTANKQLKQSRREHPDADCSVLMIVNNGYTTLNQEALKALVAHRVRQDTSEIDAIVVAGAYYHSDGFDSVFLWPSELVQINLARPFKEFDALRKGWHELANRFMSDMMIGKLGHNPNKGPVADTRFDYESTTFIRPAPVMGNQSEFYIHGRPRRNSTGIARSPPVGVTFPSLTRSEWKRFNALLGPAHLLGSYEQWKRHEQEGREESDPLQPFVTIPLTMGVFEKWCATQEIDPADASIFSCGNDLFSRKVRDLVLQSDRVPRRGVTAAVWLPRSPARPGLVRGPRLAG